MIIAIKFDFHWDGGIMITWKCLYKLDKEELSGIVNDIENGESYTVSGWEETYPTDDDILKYAARCGVR